MDKPTIGRRGKMFKFTHLEAGEVTPGWFVSDEQMEEQVEAVAVALCNVNRHTKVDIPWEDYVQGSVRNYWRHMARRLLGYTEEK